MNTLPIEEHFPTGHGGETLVLMVCAGFLWAGRYGQSTAGAPKQVAVSVARRVTARTSTLHVGGARFALNPLALQRACRWLDRQGVKVRESRA
ncbi:hypothetical protein ARC78_07485 [Stenotrophomonas pictorum JCM 9942]|uniref:Uncharacterized protein n=1 Tax=Stenotrophomonas pictorum JCM 9942 TaxID=1236960 RepID=A0A0R0AE03_9GAMM|nr:hypothetical protein [Stenotrophomonas pictorum]KRG43200.1 hypothetical protein ARC78_07485 [Stenotrophomonas pictorum JCM 9942]